MAYFRWKHPLDYSRITDKLLMGVAPKMVDIATLKNLNVELIVNMTQTTTLTYLRIGTPKILWVPSWDSKFLPIRPHKLVKAVKQCQKVINAGGVVYVHCRRGRHRSLVMCAAILISQGRSAKDAVALIKKRRPVADPDAPHIKNAVADFDKLWRSQNKW